jgi:hypothetical protein
MRFIESRLRGLAQVNGWRGNTSFAHPVLLLLCPPLDLSFDLLIVFLNVIGGFTDKTAY